MASLHVLWRGVSPCSGTRAAGTPTPRVVAGTPRPCRHPRLRGRVGGSSRQAGRPRGGPQGGTVALHRLCAGKVDSSVRSEDSHRTAEARTGALYVCIPTKELPGQGLRNRPGLYRLIDR